MIGKSYPAEEGAAFAVSADFMPANIRRIWRKAINWFLRQPDAKTHFFSSTQNQALSAILFLYETIVGAGPL